MLDLNMESIKNQVKNMYAKCMKVINGKNTWENIWNLALKKVDELHPWIGCVHQEITTRNWK